MSYLTRSTFLGLTSPPPGLLVRTSLPRRATVRDWPGDWLAAPAERDRFTCERLLACADFTPPPRAVVLRVAVLLPFLSLRP